MMHEAIDKIPHAPAYDQRRADLLDMTAPVRPQQHGARHDQEEPGRDGEHGQTDPRGPCDSQTQKRARILSIHEGEGMVKHVAGFPLGPCGTGRHFHCIPV